jgi:deazaflavin-dependent oxidoreductase (nitroreductase family)
MAIIDNRHVAPAGRGAASPWLKRANRVIIGLQRLGLAFGPMHLLTVPGRKTGKPRTTPVAVVTVAGVRYLVQAFPEAAWVKNATAAGSGVLARGRTRTRVTLTPLPVRERAAILRELPVVAAGATGVFVKSGMVSSPDPDGFAAAAPRSSVFRIGDAVPGTEPASPRRAEPGRPAQPSPVTRSAPATAGQAPARDIRRRLAVIQGWLAMFTVAVIVAEFGLAGLGAFRGAGAARTQDSFYDPHRMLGAAIGGLAVLLLLAAIAARTSRRAVVLAVALAFLAGAGQPLLVQLAGAHGAWPGALHAINGLLILGVTAALARDARAHRDDESQELQPSSGPAGGHHV